MQDIVPKALVDLLPENLRAYALFIVGGAVCFGLVIGLLVLVAIFKLLFGRSKPTAVKKDPLIEDLTEYPDLQSRSSDRQLRVEGVPARLRLVVLAPSGTQSEIDVDELADILDRLVPGLGEIYKYDKPRVKVWPMQVSYKGFATHFHRNMETGAKEGELTRWVTVAGRAKLGKFQVLVGFALQTIKPNTIGRRTLDAHEWPNVLRVRVKD